MGKEEKEETGFGFKDKAKAEETLRLLEAHDASYRRLTVRGLLGRARRVLTLTKDKDKINNIKEAMEVFDNWLAQLDNNKDKKPDREKKPDKKEEKTSGDEETSKAEKEEKEETGFGFKDKAKAEETLRLLEAHDASYRRLTVRGLLGRARRVLTLTKDKDKINNIKEAMEVFDNWLAQLDNNKDKKPDREKKPDKKEEKTSDDEPSNDEEKDKTTKEMQELKLKEKSQEMEHDGDARKDGGSKTKDGDGKTKDGDKRDRKRRSSAKSDDESHSKKKK